MANALRRLATSREAWDLNWAICIGLRKALVESSHRHGLFLGLSFKGCLYFISPGDTEEKQVRSSGGLGLECLKSGRVEEVTWDELSASDFDRSSHQPIISFSFAGWMGAVSGGLSALGAGQHDEPGFTDRFQGVYEPLELYIQHRE